MDGVTFYKYNEKAFDLSMYAGYMACFQHDEIAKILFDDGKGRIMTEPIKRINSVIVHLYKWLCVTDYETDFIDKRIIDIHANIIKYNYAYMKFIQFCFIGVLYLIPDKFFFKNVTDENLIRFSKHWGEIMKKLGFVDRIFLDGDLKAIRSDMNKQKQILLSKININPIEQQLFFITVRSISSTFSREYSKSLLCYYYNCMDLPIGTWIDYSNIRIFIVNVTLSVLMYLWSY